MAATGPSAVGAPKAEQDEGPSTSGSGGATVKGSFRFWHEERRFKGNGEKCIVQRALFENGGVRTGGYPKAAPIPGPLGWQRAGDWDFLWAPARLALKAVPQLKPGQLVSACPGLMAITKKRRLPATLCEALGESLAWEIVPHSFQLPDQLQQLGAWAQSHPDLGSELWILKTAQHLGKGLKLVPLEGAAAEAAKPRRRPTQKPYVLAQRYVDRPLLVEGRKFGLRVWVAVTGYNPLRAYLHTNGLVLFSTHGYDSSSWRTEGGDVALGHITNYAQNVDGTVWDLQRLQQHMGHEAYDKMWRLVQRNSALIIASCLKHIKADHEVLKVPSGMTCEVVGLDFLIDADLHPWLLEVNGTPSLQVEHENPAVESLIHDQKYGMVKDLMAMLGVRERFKPRYALMRAAAKAKQQQTLSAVAAAASAAGASAASLAAAAASSGAKATAATAALQRRLKEQMLPSTDAGVFGQVARELAHRGGFVPLMTLMPMDQQPGVCVPWDERDLMLRQLMESGGLGAEPATGEVSGSGQGELLVAGAGAGLGLGLGLGGGRACSSEGGSAAAGSGAESSGAFPEGPAARAGGRRFFGAGRAAESDGDGLATDEEEEDEEDDD